MNERISNRTTIVLQNNSISVVTIKRTFTRAAFVDVDNSTAFPTDPLIVFILVVASHFLVITYTRFVMATQNATMLMVKLIFSLVISPPETFCKLLLKDQSS